MRLFVAVDISDETREQLKGLRNQFDALLACARNPPRVRWVAPSMAHVTMRFIGEVPAEKAEAIDAALAAPFELSPFDVRWSTFGAFPRARAPRALWIGASEGGEALGHLAAAVNRRLDPVIGPGESRPLTPHLTVGRVKQAGHGFDWQRAMAEVRAGATTSRVDHVTLYQSRTSPDGATYTAVSRFDFNA